MLVIYQAIVGRNEGGVFVCCFEGFFNTVLHYSRQAKLLVRLPKNWFILCIKIMIWNNKVMGYKIFPALSCSINVKSVILNRRGKEPPPKLYSLVMPPLSSQQKGLTSVPDPESSTWAEDSQIGIWASRKNSASFSWYEQRLANRLEVHAKVRKQSLLTGKS